MVNQHTGHPRLTPLPSVYLAPSLRTHAKAPRRLTRSLSFIGGSEIVESIHDEIDVSSLRIVEVENEDRQQHDDANRRKVSSILKAQSALDDDVCPNAPWVMGDGCHQTFQLDTLVSSIPSLHRRRTAFLESISDPVPIIALQRIGAINYHAGTAKLVALRTESDGNCLNHAASLAIWGIHDRRLVIRNAVRSFLSSSSSTSHGGSTGGGGRMVRLIRRAWEHELGKHGVKLEKEALDAEWKVRREIKQAIVA